MRSFSFKTALLGGAASVALAGAVVATTAPAASALDYNKWYLCATSYLQSPADECLSGWGHVPWTSQSPKLMNDAISSISTNDYAIETWNDYNFKGSYAKWEPHWRYNTLSFPYNNAISSWSTPGY